MHVCHTSCPSMPNFKIWFPFNFGVNHIHFKQGFQKMFIIFAVFHPFHDLLLNKMINILSSRLYYLLKGDDLPPDSSKSQHWMSIFMEIAGYLLSNEKDLNSVSKLRMFNLVLHNQKSNQKPTTYLYVTYFLNL